MNTIRLENGHIVIENDVMQIVMAEESDKLWHYVVKSTGYSVLIAGPWFELDKRFIAGPSTGWTWDQPVRSVTSDVNEYVLHTGDEPKGRGPRLEVQLRVANQSPVVRFRYRLSASEEMTLTKTGGLDHLTYLSTVISEAQTVHEIRLSEFNEWVHSFCLSERKVSDQDFSHGMRLMGPILVGEGSGHSMILAYEHGSQVPDAFIEFCTAPGGTIALRAVKGNYLSGQVVSEATGWQSVWLQVGAIVGTMEDLKNAYRSFVLRDMSPTSESRTPYIFYNTWAFQERNKHWYQNNYLDSMTEARILQEIEVAHQMGIEVFVLDTGWYVKTGDWEVNEDRFPNRLAAVRERLQAYGMQLGLWFGPTSVALNSEMYRRYGQYAMSWQGRVREPRPIWETEVSQDLCLVSPYAKAFADRLIQLHQELGVTYFKWDAVGQYGCDAIGHDHGGARQSAQERADRYAYALGPVLTDIAETVVAACPKAIVDFDVTEGGRAMGLGFLAAGKYFLINNGPYYHNYDLPLGLNRGNPNIFFYPGSARGWICRTPLSFDQWIPSVLFLTHYLPDDPKISQLENLASLMLGQNGIWGDLLTVSDAGVERISAILARYKVIRQDITESQPVCSGAVGGNPEIHEKIFDRTGRGIIAIFASVAGTYHYVSTHRVDARMWHTENVEVRLDDCGYAEIHVGFDKAGAAIVLFGVGSVPVAGGEDVEFGGQS